MWGFIRGKVIVSLLVMLTVSLVGFALLHLSGDLAATLAGENASAEQIEAVRRQMGLDQPLLAQYAQWLAGAFRGDLGASFFSREAVSTLFLARIGTTAILAVGALILAIAVSLPLGMLAALRPNSWLDRLVSALALAGQAVPSFFLALMMVSLFGVTLRWLPISGSTTPLHFVMPITVLAIGAIPALMRMTRSGMLEVLDQDYIRTARSKGVSGVRIMVRHALLNAILPLISLSAVQLGTLLGGSVIVESVFAIDGIGLLTYRSIQRGDFPVVQATLMFVSVAYIVLTLLADILNAWLDPRLQQRRTG
ncbi:ABC transporter permease [Chelatococcus asaccharovorans]|uniref:ABC transporter permease n=1 Tax=Chelatococcus asaccharovorans TaxID=28210 RepID=UPI00224C78A7|nr:ABC transporter permease [Chelatococcus asaccharovorans]CAH1657496.1 putative peptide transport system permease protein BAB2_1050 [Chelatococcus asaccharovorans]CAH1687668.1 putative peptide transport system permease protein BAB2_1050 [Chelatococcus asaccharovorans]